MKTLNPYFQSYPFKLVLLALLYIVTGKLGLMLAVPPGYATFIWPPSGIALGMLIVHGWRLWPGVLIGSFILNCYIGGAYSPEEGFILGKTLVAIGIATGSTIQALIGRALIAKYIGLPLRLNYIKQMLGLFVLAGPVACLIAASVGIGTLYYSGVLPAASLMGNWLAWWTGDMFGILVFLPLMLVAPGSPNRLIWRENAVSGLPVIAMLVLIMPLGLTFYAWKIASESSYEKAQLKFQTLAVESEKALQHRLASYENALLGGAGFIQGSDFVSRGEWKSYVDTIDVQSYFPGINGIGWIERVTEENLAAFKAIQRKNDAPEFSVHPQTRDKPHYIITYIEPVVINKQAVGLNIAFEAHRLEAANLARDNGKPAITKYITLVQDDQKTPGFLLLHPVYQKDKPVQTKEERHAAIRGWVYAPFIAKNFLKDLTNSQGNLINLRIYDGDSESPEALIYNSSSTSQAAKSAFTMRKTLEVMQQKWLIVWDSTLQYEHSEQTDNPLIVLVGGLLFTGMFGIFLMVVTIRRTETMEWMAGERSYMLPLAIFVVLSLGSYAMYQTLQQRETNYVKKLVEDEANKIELLMNAQTDSRLTALKRMAQRWVQNGGTPIAAWQSDAKHYLEDFKSLKTLEWVDSTYHVRWAEPLKGNEKAIGLNIVFDEARKKALEGAAERNSPTLTPPLRLVQGYDAFIVYYPLMVKGKFDGFLAGIFSIQDYFDRAVSRELGDNFAVITSYQGKEFYNSNNEQAPLVDSMALDKTIPISDKQWDMRVLPTQRFVEKEKTSLPNIIFVAGLVIAALSALTLRSILLARLKSGYLAQANHELVESQGAISKAVEGISRIDPQGRYMTVNAAYAGTAGYTPEELVGKPWSVTVHPDDMPHLEQAYADMLRDGKVVAEARGIKKDGSQFYKRVTMISQYDDAGTFIGHHCFMQDISERKKAEEALKTSEETFRLAIENASIGMALVEPGGRFLKVNKALVDMLGYETTEMLQNDFQSITHPEDLEADLENVRKVIADEIKSYSLEKRYYHKNGKIIWTQLSVSLVRDAMGNPNYFIAQIQDITEQKEMERMKSEFISIVSHELRTPLTSIRGSLGLMVGAMAKELPEKANKLLNIAHQNSERLILLINDMLDIDKIASGQMRFDMKEEALAPLIQKTVETNQPYADKFSVTLKAQQSDESLKVNIDSARLLQVLANLISNAAKFSSMGDTVEITTETSDTHVRISIMDHGPGIPDEFRSRIFGKFSQADSSATRAKGGTGLGLHISKQIIEHMGGRIGFDTEVGKGTTFWIELPVAVPTKAIPDDSKDTLLHFRERHTDSPTILHIEDDSDLSNVLATALYGKANVLTATTLKQAKKLLRTQQFNMIVLDIGMPDGSGLGLLEILPEFKKPTPPVVILSAQEPPDEVRHAVAATMVKSRMSETKIVETILQILDENSMNGGQP